MSMKIDGLSLLGATVAIGATASALLGSGINVAPIATPNELATRAGAMYSAANQAAAALTTGLATTYTGLCLINPAGSGKDLVLEQFTVSTSAAHSALSNYGLLAGWAPTGVTAFTAIARNLWGSNLIGTTDTNNSVASVAAAGVTIVGTPRYLTHFGSGFTTQSLNSTGIMDINGRIVVKPGGYVAASAILAYTAAAWFSFTWKEVANS